MHAYKLYDIIIHAQENGKVIYYLHFGYVKQTYISWYFIGVRYSSDQYCDPFFYIYTYTHKNLIQL